MDSAEKPGDPLTGPAPVLIALSRGAPLVGAGPGFPSTEAVVEALVRQGVSFAFVRPKQGESHPEAVVVYDRRDGWGPLVSHLTEEGAAVVLLGAPLGRSEPASQAAGPLRTAATPEQLVAALYRAQGFLEARRGRVRPEVDRAERAESAGLVNRFVQSIASQFTVPEIVRVAVNKTRALCDAEGASLLLVDPATGALYFDTVAGAGSDRLERVRLATGQGIAGAVAMRATPMLVADVRECSDFDPATDTHTGFHTRSVIAVPLVLGGDVLGVLEAVRSAAHPPFGQEHLGRLEQLAPHVAIAVHNAQITTELRATRSAVLAANAGLEAKVQERTQQISRAKREWERTFDAIQEPIALQQGFEVRRVNAAYAARVGVPITRIPGQTCYQLLAGRESPCAGCPLTRGRSAELRGELAMSGSSILRFSGYWMTEDPADRAVVVHYQDVTHQRVLQERLRESERLAAVGQLASGAAHEINNPLGFLTSNLCSLRATLDELRPAGRAKPATCTELATALEEGLEMISESLEGARRVADIVKGLRELSRLEIGRLEPCCVNASVTRALRAELGDDASKVERSLDEGATAIIPPLQLDQVLGHILRNARQAVADPSHISVRTSADAREVKIEVRDRGEGIPPENLHRIFEPFFTTRGIGKGIGLGLTAAYGIVNRVGGTIDVASEPDKGSTFTVRVPRALPAGDSPGTTAGGPLHS